MQRAFVWVLMFSEGLPSMFIQIEIKSPLIIYIHLLVLIALRYQSKTLYLRAVSSPQLWQWQDSLSWPFWRLLVVWSGQLRSSSRNSTMNFTDLSTSSCACWPWSDDRHVDIKWDEAKKKNTFNHVTKRTSIISIHTNSRWGLRMFFKRILFRFSHACLHSSHSDMRTSVIWHVDSTVLSPHLWSWQSCC